MTPHIGKPTTKDPEIVPRPGQKRTIGQVYGALGADGVPSDVKSMEGWHHWAGAMGMAYGLAGPMSKIVRMIGMRALGRRIAHQVGGPIPPWPRLADMV